MDDFSGRTLLLTGASGGIGAAIAEEFHRRGANLMLGDTSVETLEQMVDAGNLLSGPSHLLAGDVRDPEYAPALVAEGMQRFGRIDYVIPCAGILRHATLSELSREEWDLVLSVNAGAALELIQHAVGNLGDDSAVVLLSSIAAHRGMAEAAHYAASKGAISSLTKSLAVELAPRIRVNAIAPGLIDTGMTAQRQKTDVGRRTLAQTPLGRIGKPRDIAGVAAFLCSAAASFITGQILHVNGGVVMVG